MDKDNFLLPLCEASIQCSSKKKWHKPDVIKFWQDKVEEARIQLYSHSEYGWYYPLVTLLTGFITFSLRHYFSGWDLLGIAVLVWLLNGIVLVPIIIGAVPLLFQVVALIADAIVIEPIAYLFTEKESKNCCKNN